MGIFTFVCVCVVCREEETIYHRMIRMKEGETKTETLLYRTLLRFRHISLKGSKRITVSTNYKISWLKDNPKVIIISHDMSYTSMY